MKQVFPLLLILVPALLFFSCDPNRKCEKANCPSYTVCQTGQCLCSAGYEGEFCDVLSYEKYLGSYQVSENCSPNPGSFYFVTITKYGSDPYTISINNMLDLGLSAEANVSGEFLTIPSQNMGSLTINGDGQFYSNNGRIVLQYQHDYGNSLNTCSATLIPY